MQSLPPSHEIDARYMGHALTVLEDMADDVAEEWSRLGAIINQHKDLHGVRVHIPLICSGQLFDQWSPGGAVQAFVSIFKNWQKDLTANGLLNWTAMFFDAVPQPDGNIRTLWLPNYAEDYGKWKITLDVPNWPKVEAELNILAGGSRGTRRSAVQSRTVRESGPR